MTDNAGYYKVKDKVDAIILDALRSGPQQTYALMALLRAAGYGNAANDGPLELSYSMTGAIWRSAKNSLRERGLIYDSWDVYTMTGVKNPDPTQIFRRDLAAADLAPMQEAAHA
jgi:hypothetical protein